MSDSPPISKDSACLGQRCRTIGGVLTLSLFSWPLANADFNLESSTSLGSGFGPASEPRVTNTVAQTITVTILTTGAQKFYRLACP